MGCKNSKDAASRNGKSSDKVPERKIILIGDSGVGKSSIIHQYIKDSHKNLEPTIGVRNQYKEVDVPGGGQNGRPAKIRLNICDTAGEDAQRPMTR